MAKAVSMTDPQPSLFDNIYQQLSNGYALLAGVVTAVGGILYGIPKVYGATKRLTRGIDTLAKFATAMTPEIITALSAFGAELALPGNRSITARIEDITHALQALEAQLMAKVELERRAVWFSNADGSCRYASRELGRILGLSPDDVLGTGWAQNIPTQDRAGILKTWMDAVEGERAYTDTYIVIADGERRTVRAEGRPYFHGDRSLAGYVGEIRIEHVEKIA